MKKLFRFAVILSFSFLSLWPSLLRNNEDERLSIQRLKEGEIVSSVQSISNSRTHKCEVMGLINAPIENVWDIICDYNSYDEFMPRITVAFLVHPKIITLWQDQNIKNWNQFEAHLTKYRTESSGDNLLYFYNRFKMPWPLKDRHFVLRTERFPEIFKSQWVEIIGNTRVNEGSWELTSFENNYEMTLAVYTLYVDLGISLPKKIIENGMKGIPDIISSLRQHVHNNLCNEKLHDKK